MSRDLNYCVHLIRNLRRQVAILEERVRNLENEFYGTDEAPTQDIARTVVRRSLEAERLRNYIPQQFYE